jgi:hypothetical protein
MRAFICAAMLALATTTAAYAEERETLDCRGSVVVYDTTRPEVSWQGLPLPGDPIYRAPTTTLCSRSLSVSAAARCVSCFRVNPSQRCLSRNGSWDFT